MLLRPASEGTGVIAGGGVRAVLELGGVRNVLAKSLGTTNPINMAKATVAALQDLRRPEDVARIRGKRISEVLPLPAEAARRGGGAARGGRAREPRSSRSSRPSIEEAPAGARRRLPRSRPPRPKSRSPRPRLAEPRPAAEAPAEPAAEEKPKRRGLRRKKDDS